MHSGCFRSFPAFCLLFRRWYSAFRGMFRCLGGVVGLFGFPRWFLNFLRKRRQNVFITDFADAIDVMVRGLKAGLPVSDAMKVIAAESGPPVGPEFMEVVEGQRVGITIDQGIERMFERMPLSEVNFLGIVMAIQAKTGGNLSEALSNLSKVLRDRKKMKAKIRAVSQEAKSSAAIIGALPFVIMGALTVLNPEYLNPLFNTSAGNIMLAGCGSVDADGRSGHAQDDQFRNLRQDNRDAELCRQPAAGRNDHHHSDRHGGVCNRSDRRCPDDGVGPAQGPDEVGWTGARQAQGPAARSTDRKRKPVARQEADRPRPAVGGGTQSSARFRSRSVARFVASSRTAKRTPSGDVPCGPVRSSTGVGGSCVCLFVDALCGQSGSTHAVGGNWHWCDLRLLPPFDLCEEHGQAASGFDQESLVGCA